MVTTFFLKIEINGESPFSTITDFNLVQQYGGHHRFEVRLPLQYVEGAGVETLNKSKAYLGQSIKFEISESGNDSGAGTTLCEFNGVISGLALVRNGSVESNLVLTGFSPTIVLDHGSNTKTFAKTTLSALVTTLTSKYPFTGTFKVNPSPDPQLIFVHQNKESTFSFLCSLANRYGQWFFFDGKDYVFGKLPAGSAIDMKLGLDLKAFELGVSMVPNKFKTMGIDDSGKALQAPSLPVENLDTLSSFALTQSNKYFFEEQLYKADVSVTSLSDVQNIGKIRRAALAAQLTKFSGTSINAKLKIGSKISVSGESISSGSTTDYGSFTVISIRHVVDGQGNYENSFVAIPSALEVPPAIGADEHTAFS